MKSKSSLQREVDEALNNACATVMNAPEMRKTTEERKRKLRQYLSGILDAVLEHRKEGYMTAEELVFVLLAGSLFVQKLLVSKDKKRLPVYDDIASALAKDITREKN